MDQRKQEDLVISGASMKTSFEDLKLEVKRVLNDTRPFVLCNPDRVEVNRCNFSILKNGDALLLLEIGRASCRERV